MAVLLCRILSQSFLIKWSTKGTFSILLTCKPSQRRGNIYLFVSMNSWKQTVDEILIQVTILAHFVNCVPLSRWHSFLNCLRGCLLTAVWGLFPKFHATTNNIAGQKGHTMFQIAHTQTFEATEAFGAFASFMFRASFSASSRQLNGTSVGYDN